MRAWPFIVLIGLLGGATSAEAQPAAVVLVFDGHGGERIRSRVVEIAEEKTNLQPLGDVTATAEELDADLGTEEGITVAARALELELIVTGSVTGRGRRARARIRFVDADGDELASIRVRAPTNRRSRRAFARAVGGGFDRAIAGLEGATVDTAEATEEREEEEEEGEEAGEAEEEEEEEDDDEEEEDEQPREDGDEVDGEDERVFPTGGSHPLLRALVGMDARNRQATFHLDNGLERAYEAFFPQVSLELEIRPLSFVGNALGGLFVAFDGAVAVALGSSEELPSGAVVPIETQAYRFTVAIGYLLDLEVLEIGVSAGFAYDTFELSTNDTIPSATYVSLRPGLLARVPIMDRLLVAFLDGAVRLALDTGDLTPSLGEATSALGFDATVGVMGALDVGFTWSVRAGYVGYALSFQGTATLPDDTAVDGFDGGFHFGGQIGWQL
jgi:hypothetical protein